MKVLTELFIYLFTMKVCATSHKSELCPHYQKHKGWLAIATLKPTFTFLVGILPSKSIEYDKKKSESWFQMASPFKSKFHQQAFSAFLHLCKQALKI